jgi:hypothetical protein
MPFFAAQMPIGAETCGERFRRQAEAGEEIHLVAHHQFLRKTLGDFRHRAGGVFLDDLDLAAGDGIAMFGHVGLDAVFHHLAVVGEGAGERSDQADLDRVGGVGGDGEAEHADGCNGLQQGFEFHGCLLLLLLGEAGDGFDEPLRAPSPLQGEGTCKRRARYTK